MDFEHGYGGNLLPGKCYICGKSRDEAGTIKRYNNKYFCDKHFNEYYKYDSSSVERIKIRVRCPFCPNVIMFLEYDDVEGICSECGAEFFELHDAVVFIKQIKELKGRR